MASLMNPDLRDAICEQFVAYLVDQGQEHDFIEGHEDDCLLGIPQLMY